MPAFNEFLGAMRFGMGLVSGFTAQAEKARQANEAKQMKLLQLLKDDEHSIVALQPEEIDTQGNFMDVLFGTGQARVRSTNEPAIMVGNRGFVRRKIGTMGGDLDLKALFDTATPTAPAVTPEKTDEPPRRPYRPFAPQGTPQPSAPQETLQQRSSSLPPAATDDIIAAVQAASAASGVPAAQLFALAQVESSFNPKASTRAQNPNIPPEYDAQGLMQFIPETAKRYGVTDPFDIKQSITGAAKLWKIALDKTGGDPRRAYLEVYNPNDPNRFKAAARLQQLIGVYENVPAVRALSKQTTIQPGTFAGPGALATETGASTQGVSTPIQPGTFAGPGATVPTEQRVAGRATPAAQDIPSEITLPVALSLQQKQKAKLQEIEILYANQLKTKDNYAKKAALQERALTQIKTAHDAEYSKVRVSADKMRLDVHDPDILDALDLAESPDQLKYLRQLIAKRPKVDHLADASALIDAAPLQNKAALYSRIFPQLVSLNYKPDVIKEGLKNVMAPVEAQREITKQKTLLTDPDILVAKKKQLEDELRLRERIALEGIAPKQATELPGIVTREEALQPGREAAAARQGERAAEITSAAKKQERVESTAREILKDDVLQYYNVTTGRKANQTLKYPEFVQQTQLNDKDPTQGYKQLSITEQKRFEGYDGIIPRIETLRTLIEQVWGPQGIFDNLKPGTPRFAQAVRGGIARFLQTDPELVLLVSQIQSNVDLIRRDLGQVGTQTEQDAIRGLLGFPQGTKIPDTKAVAYGKMNNFMHAIEGSMQRLLGNPAFRVSELRPLGVALQEGTTRPAGQAPEDPLDTYLKNNTTTKPR